MTDVDWLTANRENWDDRVRIHETSDFYDLPGFRAGACSLRRFELAEIGDVSGKSLLHLQCHMGLDTLSWARRGAVVTGLDFSSAALEVATKLAEDIGVRDRARFVVSNVYDAPATLEGERFDIVYTAIGSLNYLPDINRWASVVASLLNDGGFVYIAEFHPVVEMLGVTGTVVERDYFDERPVIEDRSFTYTQLGSGAYAEDRPVAGPALEKTITVTWRRPLGAIVSALAGAGLRLNFLHEHDAMTFQRFPSLVRQGPHEYRFPEGALRVPLMYSIMATRDRQPRG